MVSIHRILTAGSVTVLFAACAGTSPPIVAPNSVSKSIALDQQPGEDWIYSGDEAHSTITIFSARGINGPPIGHITKGVVRPGRLFVDKSLNLYVANFHTVTVYAPGGTSPMLTIKNGVNFPTGLTVDAAGTVYIANSRRQTITEYPKGSTSPSIKLNLPVQPEDLATDAADNLYVSFNATSGSLRSGVLEFGHGSSDGRNLHLTIGSAGALAIDRAGNIIAVDFTSSAIDIFPPGKTHPSKQVVVTAGAPFELSLSKSEKTAYVSVLSGTTFIIQELDYPAGLELKNKITSNVGDWPLAVSPDNVLGS